MIKFILILLINSYKVLKGLQVNHRHVIEKKKNMGNLGNLNFY